MKPKLTILALLGAFAMASTANASIILGWHSFSNTTISESPDVPSTPGTGTRIEKGGIASTSLGGSETGTYGSSGVPVAAANNNNDGFLNYVGDTSGTFIILGSGSSSFITNPLVTLYFDAFVVAANMVATLNIEYGLATDGVFSGDTVIANIDLVNPQGGGYGEYAINLVGVSPPPPGVDVAFLFTSTSDLRFDNIGFTMIPEPTNVMALALLLTSGVMFRNRRRKA